VEATATSSGRPAPPPEAAVAPEEAGSCSVMRPSVLTTKWHGNGRRPAGKYSQKKQQVVSTEGPLVNAPSVDTTCQGGFSDPLPQPQASVAATASRQ
jgi:hypothetical protein